MSDSAQVTDWPLRLLLVGIMIVLIGLVIWAVIRKWTRMRRGVAPESLITSPPSTFNGADPVFALFLGTSPEGQWMHKVTFHGLGVRSRCSISWSPDGIWFQRTGEPDFFIDRSQLIDCAVGSGIAGSVRAKDSVIIFRWQLGDLVVDTGVRADTVEGHARLINLVESGECVSGHIRNVEAKGAVSDS